MHQLNQLCIWPSLPGFKSSWLPGCLLTGILAATGKYQECESFELNVIAMERLLEMKESGIQVDLSSTVHANEGFTF